MSPRTSVTAAIIVAASTASAWRLHLALFVLSFG